MNYLAHAFLAAPEAGALAGSLLGDFMAGVDLDALPPPVREGVLHHRAVDAFTDRHPTVHRSRRRLHPRFRHLRAVIVDVFYDHFLARDWRRHSPHTALPAFTAAVYRSLHTHRDALSPRLRAVAPRMARQDWLASYAAPANNTLALSGIGRRLRRPLPLAEAAAELRIHREGLAADFDEFFPELRAAHGAR